MPYTTTRRHELSSTGKKLRQLIEHKLPLSEEQQKEALKFIKACSTDELAALGLQPPPLPAVDGHHLAQLPLPQRLEAAQDIISSLQYNHSPGYFYNVSKQRPLPAILATAAAILRDPLPIKCIEAVFLGLLLTQGWGSGPGALQRMPVGFKSIGANGQVYRHIVLAVCDPGSDLFGALGLSRRSNLMFKPLTCNSLAELIQDYMEAYSGWCHRVVKVRVGLPVEHDSTYTGPVCWRYCTVSPQKRSKEGVAMLLNQHAAACNKLQEQFRAAAAAAAASSSSSSNCAGSPKPHITRPHAIQHTAAAAQQQQLGSVLPSSGAAAAAGTSGNTGGSSISSTAVHALVSPRKSFPGITTSASLARSSQVHGQQRERSRSMSPKKIDASQYRNGEPTTAAAAADPSVAAVSAVLNKCITSSSAAGQRQQGCIEGMCDSSSEEEEAFDSDSEVNAIVDSMLHHSPRHMHPRGCVVRA